MGGAQVRGRGVGGAQVRGGEGGCMLVWNEAVAVMC